MKNIRIVLLVAAVVALGIFASSCSSSKGGSYPKRLQQPVKCSGCRSIKSTKNDNKTAVIAYNEPLRSSVSN